MRRLLCSSAILLLCAGCAGTEIPGSRRHAPLFDSDVDLVRKHKIQCGDTAADVERKLGAPAYRVTTEEAGGEVADWEYQRVREVWRPTDGEDSGIDPPPDGAELAVTPQVNLLFYNGVLVAIADHRRRTFTSTREARGSGEIPAEVIEDARRKWGYPSSPAGR